jgi:hypothetical protein
MEHTAKNFVLQLGSLLTLYASVTALLMLVFGVTNILLSDLATDYYNYQSNASFVRFGIAMLVVFFPAYLVLTRYVNQSRRGEAGGAYLSLTKWLIYLSLLVGGGILLGDFVMIILTFLEGEITTRFIVKALAFFVVVGSSGVYYFLDAKGYWNTHKKYSEYYGMTTIIIVIFSIVFGFTNIELPAAQRMILFDQQRVDALSNIQMQIGEYYRAKQILPDSLADLTVIGFGFEPAVDPETEVPYEYTQMAETSFQLCATFSSASTKQGVQYARPMTGFDENWDHTAGHFCFERTIDPAFFPPTIDKLQIR